MDPNLNQPLGANPINPVTQPQVQSVSTEVNTPPTSTPTPMGMPQNPEKKNNKTLILLIILLILTIGMVTYILFAKNQMNKAQKVTVDSSNVLIPSPTLSPTLAPENDLEVSSPEADLQNLENDVNAL